MFQACIAGRRRRRRRPKLSLRPPFTSGLEICVREERKPADFRNLSEHNFGVRYQNEICES